MKSVVSVKPLDPTKEYPWLGMYKNGGIIIVILFTKPRGGTVVHSEGANNTKVGDRSSMWSEKEYVATTLLLSSE